MCAVQLCWKMRKQPFWRPLGKLPTNSLSRVTHFHNLFTALCVPACVLVQVWESRDQLNLRIQYNSRWADWEVEHLALTSSSLFFLYWHLRASTDGSVSIRRIDGARSHISESTPEILLAMSVSCRVWVNLQICLTCG